MTTKSTTRPLLRLKPMKALATAVLAVPLMACNYKGSAYDCAVEDLDEDGFCVEAQTDGGQTDGGQSDGGQILPPQDGGDGDASSQDAGAELSIDAGQTPDVEQDAGEQPESDAGDGTESPADGGGQ